MKSFIIQNDLFKKVIKKTGLAISKKPTVPAITNLLCRVKPGEATFIATDLELTILYTIECKSTEEFEFMLPFDFLTKIIALHTGEPMTIELKGSNVLLKGATDVYEISKVTKVKDFPAIPEINQPETVAVDSNMIGLLAKAIDTVSDDTKRPAMQKICFELAPGQVTIASTDATVLFTFKMPADCNVTQSLLISTKIARALEGLTSAQLAWNENHIVFKGDHITIIATKSVERYPDYRRLIPAFQPNITVSRQRLIDALIKTCITSNELKQTVLHLMKGQDKILLESEDKDLKAKITAEVPGQYTGQVDQITVDAKGFIALLNQVGYETIRLHIEQPSKPVLVTTDGDQNYLGLIVPYQNKS